MEPERIEHLKMIQGVITRMAQNSFLLKGWSITLVTALVAVALSATGKRYALLAFYPALAFWGLDAFYLRQERLFRRLHEAVAAAGDNRPPIFSLDTRAVAADAPSWRSALFSRTVLPLHGSVLFVVLVVVVIAIMR
jgi:hypothetical protein